MDSDEDAFWDSLEEGTKTEWGIWTLEYHIALIWSHRDDAIRNRGADYTVVHCADEMIAVLEVAKERILHTRKSDDEVMAFTERTLHTESRVLRAFRERYPLVLARGSGEEGEDAMRRRNLFMDACDDVDTALEDLFLAAGLDVASVDGGGREEAESLARSQVAAGDVAARAAGEETAEDGAG
ncbi:hypothetical protein ANO11243_066320 [Dothideomycetidae sp. 11243]|nr:hypothetical protein ANO11243_066320 [fungal sp. No.11243]